MSGSLPADVVATLFVSGVANRPQRVWAQESVRFTVEFRDGPRGPLIDVAGVTIAFRLPTGGEEIAPVGFVVRLGVGTYACAIVPATPGPWQAVARCTSPTASLDVKTFHVEALPAGTPPPATTLLTDDSGLFLLLTADGALISV